MVFNKQCYKKGIIYVKDALNDQNKFRTREQLIEKYDSARIELIFYLGLKTAIMKYMRSEETEKYRNNHYIVNVNSPLFKCNESIFNLRIAKSRDFYDILIDNKAVRPTSFEFWENVGIEDT